MLTDNEMLQKLQESLELRFDDQRDLFIREDDSSTGQLLLF